MGWMRSRKGNDEIRMTKSERNPNDEARESQRDSATKQPDRSGSSYVVLIQGCEQRATLGKSALWSQPRRGCAHSFYQASPGAPSSKESPNTRVFYRWRNSFG